MCLKANSRKDICSTQFVNFKGRFAELYVLLPLRLVKFRIVFYFTVCGELNNPL